MPAFSGCSLRIGGRRRGASSRANGFRQGGSLARAALEATAFQTRRSTRRGHAPTPVCRCGHSRWMAAWSPTRPSCNSKRTSSVCRSSGRGSPRRRPSGRPMPPGWRWASGRRRTAGEVGGGSPLDAEDGRRSRSAPDPVAARGSSNLRLGERLDPLDSPHGIPLQLGARDAQTRSSSTARTPARSTPRFWLLLVLAAVIASAGVVADSTATVIGAMIVAPLMTPIPGTMLATVLGTGPTSSARCCSSLAGAAAAMAIGYVVGTLVVTDVLAARTRRSRAA